VSIHGDCAILTSALWADGLSALVRA